MLTLMLLHGLLKMAWLMQTPASNDKKILLFMKNRNLQNYFIDFSRVRNWPCDVRDAQQSGKDEFSFTELVPPDECPCLTIIRKDK